MSSYIHKLESKWRVILSEVMSILDQERGVFEPEDEGLTETGDWKQEYDENGPSIIT